MYLKKNDYQTTLKKTFKFIILVKETVIFNKDIISKKNLSNI